MMRFLKTDHHLTLVDLESLCEDIALAVQNQLRPLGLNLFDLTKVEKRQLLIYQVLLSLDQVYKEHGPANRTILYSETHTNSLWPEIIHEIINISNVFPVLVHHGSLSFSKIMKEGVRDGEQREFWQELRPKYLYFDSSRYSRRSQKDFCKKWQVKLDKTSTFFRQDI